MGKLFSIFYYYNVNSQFQEYLLRTGVKFLLRRIFDFEFDFEPARLKNVETTIIYTHVINQGGKGLILKPEYWRYSSARTWLNGEENDVKICMDYIFQD